MVNCGRWPVGVCTWSLEPTGLSIAEAMDALGLECMHLDTRPACIDDDYDYLEQVARHGWQVSATMIGFPQEDYSTLESIRLTGGVAPDDCWDDNRKIFLAAIKLTAELRVEYLTTHIGFINHSEPAYAAKFYDRVRLMADAAGEKDVTLLLETGQETADELVRFLEKLDHPALAVNFDPANMILYDKGEPVEALRALEPWIKHVHIKDARRTETPGTWGVEVPWGQGQVGGERFLEALDAAGFAGALAIEREAGDDRLGDIKQAIERLSKFKT